MNRLLNGYFILANWLMERGFKENLYRPWQAHGQLVIVMSTGLLMWAYALLAYLTIDDPIPGIVGLVMSILHLLSPLALRYPGNIHIAAHLLIGAGLIHQGTFAYYSGGFNSNIIIWYGILPMLAGIILGRIGILIWMPLTTVTAAMALYKMLYLKPFPMLISNNGWIIAQGMMVFGWIFLSSCTIYVFVLLMEKHNEDLADKASKIRTLVRVLCHDISNPLTTVKNRVKMTEKYINDEKVKERFQKIQRPLVSIQGIIDQVRNWEAIESGKLDLKLNSILINEVIADTIDLFEEKLQEKELTISLDIPQEEIYVFAEKTTLQSQILSNIISNAIKFSNQGDQISIHVRDEDGMVKIAISDQGIGIPESILKYLFDPAKKTSRSGTQGESGTGFGMPIVKAYIEKFGGQINVLTQTNSKDKIIDINSSQTGTTFEILLPISQHHDNSDSKYTQKLKTQS
jgi:nitrogen-specific signal transduction histidine kinase